MPLTPAQSYSQPSARKARISSCRAFSTSRAPARSTALLTSTPAANSGPVRRSRGNAARNCAASESRGRRVPSRRTMG